jgi:hypothetical protein
LLNAGRLAQTQIGKSGIALFIPACRTGGSDAGYQESVDMPNENEMILSEARIQLTHQPILHIFRLGKTMPEHPRKNGDSSGSGAK